MPMVWLSVIRSSFERSISLKSVGHYQVGGKWESLHPKYIESNGKEEPIYIQG